MHYGLPPNSSRKGKAMRTTLAMLTVLTIIVMGLTGYGEDEPGHYDIVVENDLWLFGTCDIYLDGSYQFTLEVGETGVMEGVTEGEHTITAKDVDNDVLSKGTVDLESSINWSLNENLSLDWMFDW